MRLDSLWLIISADSISRSAIPPPPRYPTANGLPPTPIETANQLSKPEGPEYAFQSGEGTLFTTCDQVQADLVQVHMFCETTCNLQRPHPIPQRRRSRILTR